MTRKPLEAVNPEVTLVEYDTKIGCGLVVINGTKYVMFAVREAGRTVALRLRKSDDAPAGEMECHTIGFEVTPWTCNCNDATYRPGRPGGCKHVVALKKVRNEMRCEQAKN